MGSALASFLSSLTVARADRRRDGPYLKDNPDSEPPAMGHDLLPAQYGTTSDCSSPRVYDAGQPIQGETRRKSRVVPGDHSAAVKLLENPTPDVELIQHVRDVFTILTYLLNVPAAPEQSHESLLTGFIFMRTYHLIFNHLRA
ncbi:hypothetical protein C8Q80DRAFT_1274270 [Daedaleopsis nitida]|nr:hypothetical protein C8Q80DRAFT_1274270 [Daedaleopsis nitida]